ncbi:MAG: NAD(P)H-hydrate dehydratase [Flavobacteriales bacterium]|nr:NAD(P)H-hydrate dehydratase [Flavobacteriales bacterium]
MIPVLGPSAIREADARTIANEPIRSWALMERAAGQCAERIRARYQAGRFGPSDRVQFLVVAGPGNNGGDGLAIARMLRQAGLSVRVLLVRYGESATEDNTTNEQKALTAGVSVADLSEAEHRFEVLQNEVVIDALLGTGLSKPVHGWVSEVIERMNNSGRPIIAIDLPSGLHADGDDLGGSMVNATLTLSFQVPKLAFFLADKAQGVGEWEILPIGLDPEFLASMPTDYRLIEEADIQALFRPRERFAHKGSFGHALLVAGSKGRMGAATMAVRAALRSGVGLVTAHVPGCGLELLQSAAPEAMCSVDAQEDRITALPDVGPYSAIGIGPGVGTDDRTGLVIKNLIQTTSTPCVIDADGLNTLSENPTWLAFLSAGTILTPHPKELDRLLAKPAESSKDRLVAARELAMRSRCHVVLKGAYSAICDPSGQVFFNPTGNPGMAKGGSGDALTGVLTALLAQGYPSLEACLMGVYAHGLAGDLAAETKGMDGMTVTDLIEALPGAWKRLRGV